MTTFVIERRYRGIVTDYKEAFAACFQDMEAIYAEADLKIAMTEYCRVSRCARVVKEDYPELAKNLSERQARLKSEPEYLTAMGWLRDPVGGATLPRAGASSRPRSRIEQHIVDVYHRHPTLPPATRTRIAESLAQAHSDVVSRRAKGLSSRRSREFARPYLEWQITRPGQIKLAEVIKGASESAFYGGVSLRRDDRWVHFQTAWGEWRFPASKLTNRNIERLVRVRVTEHKCLLTVEGSPHVWANTPLGIGADAGWLRTGKGIVAMTVSEQARANGIPDLVIPLSAVDAKARASELQSALDIAENNDERKEALKRSVAKHHNRAHNIALDATRKWASCLRKVCSAVAVENLNVLQLAQLGKGQRAARNRALVSPARIRECLGAEAIAVDARNTSRACATCGTILDIGKLRIIECPCGSVHHRDRNAASNIARRASVKRPELEWV